MNGTWKVTGVAGGGTAAVLVVAAVAVELLAPLLAVLLLILVITAAVLVFALIAGVVLLRRHYNPGRREQIARQGAALRAYTEQQAVGARPVTEIHYHGGTHLHLAPGATTEGIKWPALPLRDAVTEIKED